MWSVRKVLTFEAWTGIERYKWFVCLGRIPRFSTPTFTAAFDFIRGFTSEEE